MMSLLSCRVGMGEVRELLDGKIWEWDLKWRLEWEWDGNGNEVIEMGGNWYEKSVPAHLYLTLTLTFCLQDTRPVKKLSGGVLPWLDVCSKVQTCIWPS